MTINYSSKLLAHEDTLQRNPQEAAFLNLLAEIRSGNTTIERVRYLYEQGCDIFFINSVLKGTLTLKSDPLAVAAGMTISGTGCILGFMSLKRKIPAVCQISEKELYKLNSTYTLSKSFAALEAITNYRLANLRILLETGADPNYQFNFSEKPKSYEDFLLDHLEQLLYASPSQVFELTKMIQMLSEHNHHFTRINKIETAILNSLINRSSPYYSSATLILRKVRLDQIAHSSEKYVPSSDIMRLEPSSRVY
jgi:hypothetical protein